MDLAKLKTFVNLVELGSYTKTAKKLHISQPTVSSHIKYLEDTLDVPLIKKNWNYYEATETGNLIYAYASQILKLEEKIYNVVSKEREEKSHSLKITTTDKGLYIIPEITQNIKKVAPDIQLFFSISNTSSALDLFHKSAVDCLITPYLEEMKSIPAENITEIGSDRLLLAVGPDNPLLKKDKIEKEDLEKQTFILRESGSNTRKLSLEWMLDKEIEFANVYEMNYSETIVKAVEKNIGISILPKAISTFVPNQIKFLENIPGLPIERKYILISKDPHNRSIETFAAVTKKAFKKLFE
ncbi:MAG: LysR family transcriptional regulator [Peptoniphilus sp.]|nr:LysR family transcriptional regulator [Peptoniphilus sp.]